MLRSMDRQLLALREGNRPQMGTDPVEFIGQVHGACWDEPVAGHLPL